MKKDKNNKSQEDIILTQPTPAIVVEEQYIPTHNQQNQQDQQAIQPTQDQQHQEETPSDTPISQQTKLIFEREDWNSKVDSFFKTYPKAKNFVRMIGEEIVKDKALHNDENCLEKALCRVFVNVYVEPQNLAQDSNFLNEYIYDNDAIKKTIIDNYLEELQSAMPPKAIASRGHITLTPPDRPNSIAQAGEVIKAMLTNRRI